jgi:hypothetical protein
MFSRDVSVAHEWAAAFDISHVQKAVVLGAVKVKLIRARVFPLSVASMKPCSRGSLCEATLLVTATALLSFAGQT